MFGALVLAVHEVAGPLVQGLSRAVLGAVVLGRQLREELGQDQGRERGVLAAHQRRRRDALHERFADLDLTPSDRSRVLVSPVCGIARTSSVSPG